ncbi:carcinoembryonic antigen-related cell adhesion molecule 1 [Microcaecilia unicolor]|uniref:Carcinoembryonic antigen-related cell adhesion molecule 1-like n=1 Tax=Microcaecilia unicolor TaxID=1415580 RepID=A0A6P7Z0E1_9AMPH|nr:carcinoembryonic antigen-related cell adhesion molecule 1-like [Microcaecilia unicolor]
MEFVFCNRCPADWGFILTVFLGLWSWQISAHIFVSPIPKTPVVRENVLLSVSGVTENIMFFSWYRGEGINTATQMLIYVSAATPPEQTYSPYKGRVRGFPNGSMEISEITIQDSGTYTLEIQTDKGIEQAAVIIVVYEILGKPSVTSNLAHPMEHKDSVTLTCVTTNTTQTILWSKDSQRLPSDHRMSLSQKNRTLTIFSVSRADSENYQCEVINPVSHNMSDPYTLTVNSSSVEQPDRTLQIAVGAAIGAGLGIALLITTAVLLYKKCGNCQRREKGVGGNIYMVPDVSGAPPNQYSNVIVHKQEGIYINTFNLKAPDSTYTDLLFGNQSVYSELKREIEPSTSTPSGISQSKCLEIWTVSCSSSETCNASSGMEFVFCRRCLILTVFLSLWSQQISAQVSVVPIPKTAIVGENVLLSVSGVTGTILLFSWHKGESTDKNQMLMYSPNETPPEQIEEPYRGQVRVFPNCSMEILGVNINDNGSYTVNIQTRGGQQQQQRATVTIIIYEKVSKPNVTSNLACPVEYKDSVTLTCVTTNTTQIILWSKDSQRLPSDDRMSLSQENRTLTITNVSSADSGNYQCEVMNSVSHSTSDLYTLTVCYGPKNVKITPQGPITQPLKSQLTLNCMAESIPAPDYTWTLNGTIKGHEGKLVLTEITIHDQGNYTCEANNSVTQLSGLASVYVNVASNSASSVEQPDGTWQIAVGAAIGAVLGAALIIATAVLLYKKGGKCQRKENGTGGNLYEVPDVSRAPPHQYSNIIPQNHEGIYVNNHHFHVNKQDKSAAQINTLNPKAPDSTYTDLLFKNQSVYTELKR